MPEMHYLLGSYRFTSNDCTQTSGKMTSIRRKNQHEQELLRAQFAALKQDVSFSYHKINRQEQGLKLASNLQNEAKNDLCVVVYNFVDVISHAKTEMEIIKELHLLTRPSGR